ncbi:MAG: phosphotransferase family protein, partial [Thermoleophilaceae bacterium]|nr:phosphotransferase family protein [Thermoleophilaceae bacterium]
MGNESVAKPVGTQVREEDSFDLAAVDAWLKQNVSGLVGTPEVRQLVGGASNLTYLLDYDNRRVVLRRPPVGKKAASAHDMQREFRVQQALRPVFPYVPEMLAYCGDTSIVGSDFYVMEFLDGTVLRAKTAKDEGLDEQTTRAICLSAIDRLVDLHGIDPAAAGLADLGKGDGYVGRQVAGWSKRYGDAHTWNVPSMKKVMRWLDANQPADVATCIIHNDFRIDNLVLDPADLTRVQGVLDWEMATLGDPLMDLGGAMAYWIQADDPGYMQRAR